MFDCCRIVVLAAALLAANFGARAFGQLPHLPSLPGNVGGQANAAAMAQHQAQMLKLFDLNGDGILEPNEIALAQSGLGKFLEQAANGTLGKGQAAAGGGGGGGHGGAAAANGANNLLNFFDQNGNGQLDQVELRMAQMMMLSLAGGSAMRPATGFVPVMPPDEDTSFQTAPAPSSKKARRKRAERIADFAKPKNIAPAKQAAPRAKKVKARGPMVEQNQQKGGKQAPVKGDPAE